MTESEEKPAASPAGHPASELERYLDLMRERDLSELEIREGDLYLKLVRPSGAVPAVHAVPVPVAPTPAPAAAAKARHHVITSPLAGMFYRSPAPNSPAFVKDGDKVSFGDLICIIEAMKVMNEIRSDCPGVVRKIMAENGKPVSAGQELFQIDPLP